MKINEVNQAVKNNPEKFPRGYLIEILPRKKDELVKNFDRFETLKHSSSTPVAFTEKGLYMLATILKSPQAVQTTIAIVEAFAGLRELSRNISQLSETPDEERQKSLMQRSGEILGEILDDGLKTSGIETSIEFNFAVLKVKHTVKRDAVPAEAD